MACPSERFQLQPEPETWIVGRDPQQRGQLEEWWGGPLLGWVPEWWHAWPYETPLEAQAVCEAVSGHFIRSERVMSRK